MHPCPFTRLCTRTPWQRLSKITTQKETTATTATAPCHDKVQGPITAYERHSKTKNRQLQAGPLNLMRRVHFKPRVSEPTDIDRLASEIMIRVRESFKSGFNPSTHAEDTVLTVEGLASYLLTTPKWIYNHIHELPHLKIDGLLRFRKTIIDRFFEQNPSKLPKS